MMTPSDKDTLEGSLADLETTMAEAITVQESLLAATQSERKALRSLAMQDLRAILDSKIALCSHAIRFEARREGAAIRLADCLGIDPHASLAELIELLPLAGRERLEKLSARLNRVVKALARANATNTFIASNGIYVTSNLLAALAPAAFPGDAYSGAGRGVPTGAGSIVEFTG